MQMSKKWSMPNKNTFSMKPCKELIDKYVKNDKIWIDPFANNNKIASITNDIFQGYDTNYHLDAYNFLCMFEDESVDGILFDPPYSPRQVSECYKKMNITVDMKTTQSSYWSKLKKEIARITKKDGFCITFSWNSGGIGKKYGFETIEILLVSHGGWHNDTICVVDIKK